MNIIELSQTFPFDHEVSNIGELEEFMGVPGIYAWADSVTGELWYIGKALDLHSRLDGTHNQAAHVLMKENKPYVIYLWTDLFSGVPKERLNNALVGLERFFISKYQTKWNKTYNKPPKKPNASSSWTKREGLGEEEERVSQVFEDVLTKFEDKDEGYAIYLSQLWERTVSSCGLSNEGKQSVLEMLKETNMFAFNKKKIILVNSPTGEED